MRTTLLGIAVSAIILAQDTGSSLATLSGTVKSSDGKTVSTATVRLTVDLPLLVSQNSLLRSMGRSVATDSAGKYSLHDVPPGTYRVVVEAEGYLRQEYGGKPGTTTGIPVTVNAKARISDLDVQLTRHSVISGRVTTAAGDPAPDVPVHAVSWSYTKGTRSLQEQGHGGTTDSRGNFRITDLAPGQYYVYAVPPADSPRPDKIERTAQPTYSPNALRLSEAIAVNLSIASDGFADIRLREDKQATIRGRVLVQGNGGERPPAGASVLLVQESDTPVLQGLRGASRLRQRAANQFPLPYTAITTVAADGTFELKGVLPGFHRLVAFGGKRLTLNASSNGSIKTIGLRTNEPATQDDGSMGELELSVGREDVDGAIIHLRPAGEIEIKVTVDGKTYGEWQRAGLERMASIVPANIMPDAFEMPLPVTLIPEGGLSYGGTPALRRDEPRLPSQTVSAGKYFVSISGANVLFYAKSMKLNGVDITHKPLELNGSSAELEIAMATDFGIVNGSVSDRSGKGVPRALVGLWPISRDLSRLDGGTKLAVSDDNASFAVPNIAPGEYLMVAFEDPPDPGVAQYMPFLTQFALKAKRVKVDAKGSASVSLEAIASQDIQKALATLR